MLWEETYSSVLTDAGFVRGKSSPCVFYHPKRHVTVVCHGDDFTALGSQSHLLWYKGVLEAAFELGDCRILSDDPEDCKQVKVLKRVLSRDSRGPTFEAETI